MLIAIGAFLLLIIVVGGAVFVSNNTKSNKDDSKSSQTEETSRSQSEEEDLDQSTESTSPVVFKSKLDGEAWEAAGSGMYYPNGNEFFGDEVKTYLQFTLYSIDSKDTRSIIVQVIGFKPEVGKYQGSMEVMLTGSPTGGEEDAITSGYQDDLESQKTDFTFEITKWEDISESKARLSGKINGSLKGFFGSADSKFENGVISDLEIAVYP